MRPINFVREIWYQRSLLHGQVLRDRKPGQDVKFKRVQYILKQRETAVEDGEANRCHHEVVICGVGAIVQNVFTLLSLH